MNTLAIDCSASILSITLEKENSLFESSIRDGFKNSENLMPLIENLFKTAELEPKELDLVVVASGPGSFTGLRIAMSTAKGIAMGTGADLVSVSTLNAYAYGYDFFEGIVVPVIDARKKRYYCSIFEKNVVVKSNMDISAEDLIKYISKYNNIFFTGPDCLEFSHFAENDSRIYIDKAFTSTASSAVLKLGKMKFKENGPDLKSSGPVYIRKSEAEISLLGE